MAFTSPNWCTEAGAGGNLQECQLSIPEAIPPAHLIKGLINGPGSSMSIRKDHQGTTQATDGARSDLGFAFDNDVQFLCSVEVILYPKGQRSTSLWHCNVLRKTLRLDILQHHKFWSVAIFLCKLTNWHRFTTAGW